MRGTIFYTAVSALMLAACPAFAQTDDDEEFVMISYADNFSTASDVSEKPVMIPMLTMEERANPNSSTIVLRYFGEGIDPEMLANVRKTAEYAASVWEAHILGGIEFYIDICFDDISCDIITDVRNARTGAVVEPTSLVEYKNNQLKRDPETPDGKITVNKSKKWDYGVDENISADGNNLVLLKDTR